MNLLKPGFRNCCNFTLTIFGCSKASQNLIRFKWRDTDSPLINGRSVKELVPSLTCHSLPCGHKFLHSFHMQNELTSHLLVCFSIAYIFKNQTLTRFISGSTWNSFMGSVTTLTLVCLQQNHTDTIFLSLFIPGLL